MRIITSAAYLSGDLKSEFGSIPPSFLPLKNNRLFFHQVEFFHQVDGPVFLTVPQSFDIDPFDNETIRQEAVEVIRIPDNLSLSSSVLYAVNSINQPAAEVLILHGDTLFETYPQEPDTVYIAYTKDNYNWGNVSLDANNDKSEVYAGLFYFSNQALLTACLDKYATDFIGAVEAYALEKAIRLEFINKWLDFGHANTYFRSKASMTTERVFNNLSIDAYTVNKYSDDRVKMKGEANWFQSVPPRLKKYTPNLISTHDGDKAGYELDYLYLSTLSELFVFGQNDPFVWNNIFRSCEYFINDCLILEGEQQPAGLNTQYRRLLQSKTRERLELFSKQTGISIHQSWMFNSQPVPSLKAIDEETAAHIDDECTVGYVHGDFCFSNILFDFRKQMIRVIDPRGIDFEKNITIWGDIRYDIAKLSHSVIGLYDYIIAGRFSLEADVPGASIHLNIFSNKMVDAIQAEFMKRSFVGIAVNSKQNFAFMIQLFLSMLPLHADNEKRQLALMANALGLYQKFQAL
jgi:hypothetical protein